jgi:hypothetical protein
MMIAATVYHAFFSEYLGEVDIFYYRLGGLGIFLMFGSVFRMKSDNIMEDCFER